MQHFTVDFPSLQQKPFVVEDLLGTIWFVAASKRQGQNSWRVARFSTKLIKRQSF